MQKALVYATVCAMHNHPTAQEIYEELHRVHPSVGRATVYRILGSLAKQGRILKIPVADGADCFDFNTANHVHYCCRSCGRIGDIADTVPALPIPPETAHYLLDSYTILYHGVCDACRKQAVKSP